MDGCARPVRMVPNSSLATTTAFSIFSSASRRVSSITAAPVRFLCLHAPAADGSVIPRPAYQGADLLTAHRPRDVALFHQVENDDGQAVVHAQAHRGRVHELQLAAQ